MLELRFSVWVLAAATMLIRVDDVCAQNYPAKPIRVVTTEAGGGADLVTRIVAQGLAANLGQPVVVENRGGSAIVRAQIVAQAPADGYTLFLSGSNLWTLPLMQSVPYDPVRDFLPITLADRAPNVLVVNPALAANSVKDLIALAKAKPGQLNYASGGSGTSNHLAAELFKAMAAVNLVCITYKGTAPAVNDLMAGQVQLMFATAAPVMPHIKSGRLRALAVTSAQSSALAPGLPTVAATGLPGYETATTHGFFVPAHTPSALIKRLNSEMLRVLNRPEVKEKFLSVGVEVVASSPEEFAAAIKSEMAKLGKVIKDAGIRAD